MDLNTATFEEMQSLAGIGHGRAQAIFDGRANLSRPLTLLLDLLEMGITADVVKALVDDLEIMAIPRHEDKDEGIDIQQMVIAALASLQRIFSDVNGLSVAIDNVNMRQAHFESVRKAGGRIAGPKVECGELNRWLWLQTKCWMRGARHTYLAIVRDVCREANWSIQI